MNCTQRRFKTFHGVAELETLKSLMAKAGVPVVACVVLLAFSAQAGDQGPRRPLAVRFEDTLDALWLRKPVLDQRVLDEMEDLSGWTISGKGEMALASQPVKEGGHSLRITAPTRTPEDVSPPGQRMYDRVLLTRTFAKEDWRAYNRISFWVWPDLPGWYTINLRMMLRNDGKQVSPDPFNGDGYNSIVIPRNRAWNHIVWEIPHLGRDQVTGFTFELRRQANEPQASDTIRFYFDHLTLERVDADPFEGWDVAANHIAYSQSGYSVDGPKTALASGLRAAQFSLIREETGEAVLTGPVAKRQTEIGAFDVLDFSSVREPGEYRISAGGISTPPFPIGADIWRPSLEKAVNFFYGERCGTVIPGIHRECHRDWQSAHGNERLLINGGWHDAGDLSQGTGNTAEAVYAMFLLASRMEDSPGESALAARYREEGTWGLDWLLKTRFGDGARPVFSTMGLWTDGILGNNDDIVSQASKDPLISFYAAAAEALASRTLAHHDADRATHSRTIAEADWSVGAALLESGNGPVPLQLASTGVLASVELWKLTGAAKYRELALRLAPAIVGSQQKTYTPWKTPLAGFYYTNSRKEQILHFMHPGHEQAPDVALARLCEAFPGDPHWMDWYSTVALHSEYLKRVAAFNEPYRYLPASIYREDEAEGVPEDRREFFRLQVRNGIPLGGGYYLRRFPVWFDFRGNYGVMLSQTLSLTTGALLRQDRAAASLAEEQLQWVVGRNPFALSTMYGEGRLFCSLYSAMSGQIAGALPVGIETRSEHDVPYWPASSYPNWKEVWVHPVTRWMGIVSDLQLLRARKTAGAIVVSAEAGPNQTVLVRVTGKHSGSIQLRTWNLELTSGKAGDSEFTGKIVSPDSPWIAVAVDAADPLNRAEASGGLRRPVSR